MCRTDAGAKSHTLSFPQVVFLNARASAEGVLQRLRTPIQQLVAQRLLSLLKCSVHSTLRAVYAFKAVGMFLPLCTTLGRGDAILLSVFVLLVVRQPISGYSISLRLGTCCTFAITLYTEDCKLVSRI